MGEAKRRKAAQAGIAPEGSYLASNGDGKFVDLSYAIFPILRQHSDVTKLEIVGTGFFVADPGVFITARHVFETAQESGPGAPYALGMIQFTPGGKFYDRAIRQLVVSESSDIAVGVCQEAKHNGNGAVLRNPRLRLSLRDLEEGEDIVSYAYPDSVTEHLGDKTAVHTNPHFYAGKIVKHYPEKRDSAMMNWPCFQTSMHIHGGASGGPVFDPTGSVFGINTLSLEPQTDVSYVTKIEAALAIVVNDVIVGDAPPRAYTLEEILRIQKIAPR